MKYILAIGIIYKKYKKPMTVTIKSKKFIDSFIIDKDIGSKDHPEMHSFIVEEDISSKDHPLIQLKVRPSPKFYELRDLGEFPYSEIPNKCYFYEIDGDALGDKISINFDCEDNNYTNGFMTKTSLFKLRMVSIIPKKYFKYFYKSKGQHRAIERLKKRSRKEYIKAPNSIWPYNRKNWIWSSANTDLNKEFINVDPNPAWLGGKMQVHIPIIKKFGVKMLDPFSDKNYGFILSNMFCYKSIFEKYYKLNMHNEDQ